MNKIRALSIISIGLLLFIASHTIYAAAIDTAVLKQQQRVEKKSFLGVLKPFTTALIQARASGRIEKIYVSVGDHVKKGTSLLYIANTSETLRLEAAQANYFKAMADYKAEDYSFSRAKKLYASKAISGSQYRKEQAQYNSVQSGLKVAKSNLKEATLRFQDTHVKSPMDGVIDEKKIELHRLVDIGTPLFVISSHKEIKVVVPVPVKYISRIKRGMHLRLQELNEGKVLNATVSNISPIANHATSTVDVFIYIKGRAGWYLGDTVAVEFPLKKEIAFPVPLQSVVYKNGFPEIFILEKNLAKGVKVNVVELDNNQAWIQSRQLRNGMTIATEGAVSLNNGSVFQTKKKSKKK